MNTREEGQAEDLRRKNNLIRCLWINILLNKGKPNSLFTQSPSQSIDHMTVSRPEVEPQWEEEHLQRNPSEGVELLALLPLGSDPDDGDDINCLLSSC